MRIAYFTAGTIGAGHHVRGLALRRGLARAGFGGKYRTFAPEPPFAGAPLAPDERVTIDKADLFDPSRAARSDLGRALEAWDPDVLVVDLFWAPVHHLLGRLRAEAWLLVRKCPPAWFVGPSPSMRFDRSAFRRVVAIEPRLALEFEHDEVAPVVVANHDECRPPAALKEKLGVHAGERLVVVTHAGREGERGALAPFVEAGDGAARVVDFGDVSAPFTFSAFFPAAEWLGGADAVVGGAGYNTFWESEWLGYAAKTRLHPFSRPIDDQAWRIQTCRGFTMRENGADTLARMVMRG